MNNKTDAATGSNRAKADFRSLRCRSSRHCKIASNKVDLYSELNFRIWEEMMIREQNIIEWWIPFSIPFFTPNDALTKASELTSKRKPVLFIIVLNSPMPSWKLN